MVGMTRGATVDAPAGSPAPARASLVLISLILVAAVANVNLAVANVALPYSGARTCHGGLADGIGMALMEVISFDEDGNWTTSCPLDGMPVLGAWGDRHAVTAPSDRRQGCGRVRDRRIPAAVVNAVIDALKPYGVRHADMPLTPANVWRAIQGRPLRTDMAIT